MCAKMSENGSPYLRVGTTIYKRVRQPLSSGRSIETLIPWNIETLRQDYRQQNHMTVELAEIHRVISVVFSHHYSPIPASAEWRSD